MIEIAIPIDVFLISLIALLIALVIASISSKLRPLKNRIQKRLKSIKRRKPKPASPHDCAFCCQQTTLYTTPKRNVAPYSNRKSTRGRRKQVSTQGFACPNNQCHYFGITDQNIHALVAYGQHNHIPRFKCQACRKVFSSRHGTPLYQLKSDPQTIAFVLWLLAEGVDISVMVRFTGHSHATITMWLQRMGQHAQHWHNFFFQNLNLSVIQMDELYTRVRGSASSRWLWLAIDPISKAIPSLHIGPRTKHHAFALVHDVQQRLAQNCVPAFTTDGLRAYFYAITAHFGSWTRPPRARKDHWHVNEQLQHGILIKRKQKNRKTLAITRTIQGKASDLFQKLQSVGLRCIIQTAFVERVNLTFRQAVSPLSRRTWAYAQSEKHLLLHCEWFRTYYHFVRIHESLRLPLAGKKRRYRQRTPAMALGLTDHVWTVSDLLHYPVPQVASIS
jgi:IS1 family transposase